MPKQTFYAGLSVPEALRRMAEHHYHVDTRHISEYEYELLVQVAEALKSLNSKLGH
jgi:predicted GIY-YIG superfamily endonuclease